MLAEKTRLYQAALESERALIERVGDSMSFDDEMAAAHAEVDQARAEMEQAWLKTVVG